MHYMKSGEPHHNLPLRVHAPLTYVFHDNLSTVNSSLYISTLEFDLKAQFTFLKMNQTNSVPEKESNSSLTGDPNENPKYDPYNRNRI